MWIEERKKCQKRRRKDGRRGRNEWKDRVKGRSERNEEMSVRNGERMEGEEGRRERKK